MIDLRKPAGIRLRRSARSLVRGPEILEAVLSMEDRIVSAAELDIPPVSAISSDLSDRFGKDLRAMTVRQFIGNVVKAILADHGFEVAQTGIRLPNDKVFTTGSAYRKKAAEGTEGGDRLRRAFANMVSGLSGTERRILMDELRKARGDES